MNTNNKTKSADILADFIVPMDSFREDWLLVCGHCRAENTHFLQSETDDKYRGHDSRILLYYWCEHCPWLSALEIAEHEGLIFIRVVGLNEKHSGHPLA